jgi:predicted DNA-binding transcriptional regulator AlpA
MGVKEKLADQIAYPPRLMRAERAAAYLGMSRAAFLRLVDDRVFPSGLRISNGMVGWDRLDLDAAVDDMKTKAKKPASGRNTMHELLGINHTNEDD